MTQRKRKRRPPVVDRGEAARRKLNHDHDHLAACHRRWAKRYEEAATTTDKLAAAFDWHRAAARLAAEMVGIELAELYNDSAAAGMAANAAELCDKIAEML